ncbi:uncharacterized protein EI97DRAFT_434440 [Westerdykella ornata]|uniref:Store-operated calcium entry-associated regulatory factor n=1 Tax=Westerdykella ornata TaxID=318751 RepID=A0A6A6JFL2_WESOR|nr:uncharacterized protein EI97DRAFT_434440 [Westerdykella ornata]KAF2275202.1 hypothetical protein EI97DRAFT_434440 [Westerdykella ornata]
MHPISLLSLLLFSSALPTPASALRSSNAQKIKLSNVQSLTLRKDKMTSHRRVPAIPQLRCVGGSAKGLYEVDIMRCKNEGSDYASEDIQWACTASLPEEFKLGSTDVICEGYDSPDDEYVLKGSCGVEYRLVLTEKGREKYGGGHKGGWWGDDDDDRYDGPKTFGERVANAVFWMVFLGVAGWIVYSAFIGWARGRGVNDPGVYRPGWGGGGGGGGGWGGPDDPPPPYDWQPPRNNRKPGYGSTESWRPGFWSGALGGAAAGYAAARAANRNNTGSGWGFGNSNSRWGGYDNGEGSSRSRASSSSPSHSSTRHESTGFGSTSRR